MLAQLGIQGIQKVITVFRVVFPGVFPIQDHRDNGIPFIGTGIGNVLQVMEKIGHGIIGMPGGVGEADHVGQAIITKETSR